MAEPPLHDKAMKPLDGNSLSDSLAEQARTAMRQSAWADALDCWDRCLRSTGTPKPIWLVDRARVLQRLGRVNAAADAFLAISSKYPELPDGILGLARIAMQRQEWKVALARWDECLSRFPGHRDNRWWRFERAKTLGELEQFQEGEEICASLAAENPENFQLRIALAWLKLKRSRTDGTWHIGRAEILRELEHPAFDQADQSGLIGRIDILIAMGELTSAHSSLVQLMSRLESLEACDWCLSKLPLLIELGTQGSMLETLLQHVREISSKTASKNSLAASLELSLLLALGRFTEFVGRFDATQNMITKEKDRILFGAVRRRLGLPRMHVFNEPKVFGIGLSRTGTTSLSHALDLLGVDNGHYTNPLTRQLLSDVDFFMLGGATDTPVANCFEKLFYLYRNAKFVLTTRPMHDWVRSMHAHYGSPINTRNRIGNPSGFQYGLLGEAVQVGLYLHHEQFERASIEHESRVRHFFADKPADRLLVFNVFEGHGWPELCEFLGKSQPGREFPWSNRRQN
jgi:tetratricopeptide (TPR) repeat protein